MIRTTPCTPGVQTPKRAATDITEKPVFSARVAMPMASTQAEQPLPRGEQTETGASQSGQPMPERIRGVASAASSPHGGEAQSSGRASGQIQGELPLSEADSLFPPRPVEIPKRGYFPPASSATPLPEVPRSKTAPTVSRSASLPQAEGEKSYSSARYEQSAPPLGRSNQRESLTAEELLTQFSTDRKQKKDRLFYALMVVFLVGMLYGALFATQGGQENSGILLGLSSTHEVALRQMQLASFLEGFVYSLRASLLFLLLFFLTGTSMIGQPATLGILFVRGLGVGSYLGYLYVTYGGAGVLYTTLLILPGMLLATVAFVLAGREAILFSNRTLSLHRKSSPKKLAQGQTVEASSGKPMLRLYLKKFLVLLLMLGVAAVLDTVLRTLFSTVVTLT